MKPLFPRAVRLSVVDSEILRHACDAVRVWLPRRRDCPFHQLLGLPSKAAVWSARLSESPPAFRARQYPFVRSCARASCQEYRAVVFVLRERDRENAQVTTSDLPDAHADHPYCLLT